MKNIAFVCIHNSCRSQIAEAFTRIIGLGVCRAYSAGTEKRDNINPAAVKIMKELGIDMEILQKPKLLNTLPPIDILITMGCNVNCPYIPCQHREDWGIEDPSGKSDVEFRKTRDLIKSKVEILVNQLKKE
ncbi:arsenate reductase ArsC [Pectinatus sottacetonis]|uniref:arsenate reductase ArsC n=1 Tax=Pectinatus sottacetonis TaxID=1002795 RepID=UPI0018C73781|nr:arsenate reductase ArsC [Pectinatus sottacetonis]